MSRWRCFQLIAICPSGQGLAQIIGTVVAEVEGERVEVQNGTVLPEGLQAKQAGLIGVTDGWNGQDA